MSLTAGAGAALAGGLALAGTIGATAANAGLTKAARKENYMYNEMAAKNAYERQLNYADYLQRLQYKQFYDLESPKAIIEQLKEAGLSPSIYAAGASGGGVSGTSAAGANAPQGAGASGLATQVALSPIDAANIQLSLAQANKANEEANTLRGENAMGEATIKDVLASAGLKNAQTALTNANKSFQDIQNEIAGETKESSIRKITYDAQKAYYDVSEAFAEAANSNLDFQWNAETYNERIKNVARTGAKIMADAYATTTKGHLNEEEKAKIMAETEKIYNDLFYFHDIDLQNAKAYQKWFEAQAENLPQMLEARLKELGIEKTRMWLNFGTDTAKALGTGLGMYFFGKKGGKAPIYNQQPFTTNTTKGGAANYLQLYPM